MNNVMKLPNGYEAIEVEAPTWFFNMIECECGLKVIRIFLFLVPSRRQLWMRLRHDSGFCERAVGKLVDVQKIILDRAKP